MNAVNLHKKLYKNTIQEKFINRFEFLYHLIQILNCFYPSSNNRVFPFILLSSKKDGMISTICQQTTSRKRVFIYPELKIRLSFQEHKKTCLIFTDLTRQLTNLT